MEEETKEPRPPNPIRRATHLLEQGFVGRAAKALYNTAPLAPDTEANREILRGKHPIGEKNPFNQKVRPASGPPISLEAI